MRSAGDPFFSSLLEVLLDLQRQGVLGYFKHEDNSLTVVTEQEEAEPLTWLTYAHEYAHALQHGRFGDSIREAEEDTLDASNALSALVEGDANLTAYLFYESLPIEQQTLLAETLERQSLEFSSSPEVVGAPRIISETFGWEHSIGPGFVFRLYLDGGFEAINRAFEDPPRSTEQVLHPEKYLEREVPHVVELPDLASTLGDPWQERDNGVLGELMIGIYLGTYLPEERAEAVAQGWGGDRYVLLNDDQDRLFIAMSFSWDSEADALEFFQAYFDFSIQKSKGQWELVEKDEGVRFWTGYDTSVYLAIEGDNTLVVIGPERTTVEAALAEIPNFP